MSDIKTELIERAAQAQAGHFLRVRVIPVHCTCGWSSGTYSEPDGIARLKAHLVELALEAVADDLRAEGVVKALRSAIEELERLDDGRTGGYYEAGRHIIARLRARVDRIEHDAHCPHPKCPGGGLCCCLSEQGGTWSDPAPAGEVCRCLCHESGPALEHLSGGKCPCKTSGAINPNLLRRPGAES